MKLTKEAGLNLIMGGSQIMIPLIQKVEASLKNDGKIDQLDALTIANEMVPIIIMLLSTLIKE